MGEIDCTISLVSNLENLPSYILIFIQKLCEPAAVLKKYIFSNLLEMKSFAFAI